MQVASYIKEASIQPGVLVQDVHLRIIRCKEVQSLIKMVHPISKKFASGMRDRI